MKVFDSDNTSWGSKINFVDENNVGVGYDKCQCCCEYADWFIDDIIYKSSTKYDDYVYMKEDFVNTRKKKDLDDYRFDTSFFKEIKGYEFDEGGMVVFKLVTNNKPDLYLHLFNCHNGYYGHGFEFKIGDEKIREGGL